MSIYNTKSCTKCHQIKSLEYFSNYKKAIDGKTYWCKQCVKDDYHTRRTNRSVSDIKRDCEEKRQRYTSMTIEQKAHRRYKQNEWKKNYLKKYPEERLKHNLRSRLSRSVRKGCKDCSAVRDLGCSIEFLKEHLESQFQPGMTWDNYGEWEIDHIYPLSKVDTKNTEQFKKAIHYTNLQPLWSVDNARKSDKIL